MILGRRCRLKTSLKHHVSPRLHKIGWLGISETLMEPYEKLIPGARRGDMLDLQVLQ